MARQKSARSASQIAADRANDFAKAFYALKMVFAKYEGQLHVNADTREKYYLETRSPSLNGKPLFFGAVIRGRAYVSFHLMPLYWDASLAKQSPFWIRASPLRSFECKTSHASTHAARTKQRFTSRIRGSLRIS